MLISRKFYPLFRFFVMGSSKKVNFSLFRVLTQVFQVNTKFEGVPGLIRTFFHCSIDYFSPGSLRIGLLRLQSELGGSKNVIFCLFRVLTLVFQVNTNFQGQPGLIRTFFHCLIDYSIDFEAKLTEDCQMNTDAVFVCQGVKEELKVNRRIYLQHSF